MRDFVLLMNRDATADRVVLIQMRVDFSRVFRQHLATVDALVRTWRTDAADTPQVRIAQDCVATMRLLLCDYSAHLRRWTPRDIADDMTTYRRDVAALQRRLLDLMAREERDLVPLLMRAAA